MSNLKQDFTAETLVQKIWELESETTGIVFDLADCDLSPQQVEKMQTRGKAAMRELKELKTRADRCRIDYQKPGPCVGCF
jgi:hypothetical protein